MNINLALKKLEQEEGFFSHNNYHIVSITKDDITIRADITQSALNPYGHAHGGFIFGLSDTLMGMLASHTGRQAVTLESNISYLQPGTGKYLIAKGKIIKEGKNICFLQSEIYNDQKKLIATSTATYYYINIRKKEENDG